MKCTVTVVISMFVLGGNSGCSSAGPQKADKPALLPEAGVVHEHINGFTDNGISYALYIPTPNPSPNEEGRVGWPVMVFFDPHGSGVLPVKKYNDLAEKYGFILIGSDNSRNGLAGPEIKSIVSSVLREILAVYPVDTNRIYMAGFSGGSRVAGLAAIENPAVRGVICCGAGLPGGYHLQQNCKFDFFGMVGTADFNMNEMLQLEEPITRAGLRHFITTFPGPHEWPPAIVMEEGFQWITLNAMRDGLQKKDDALISQIMSGFSQRISDAIKVDHLIPAADICREAIQFADGLIPAEDFKKQLETIKLLPEYRSQVSYRATVMRREAEERLLLENSLLSKDLSWWKNRVDRMGAMFMTGKNPEDTLMNARLKTFLSLLCYSYANAAMTHQEYVEVEKLVAVYEIADPPNPEPNFMRAVVFASRQDNEAALGQLKVAVSKGFADKKRLTEQQEFQELKSSPGWFDMIKSLK